MGASEGNQRDRIRELERIVERQQANIDELYASVGQPVASPQTRIARVVEVTTYPSSPANTYGIVFLDGTYTESEGDQTPTWTERQTSADAYAHDVSDNGYVAEDSVVFVIRQNGKWWITYVAASRTTCLLALINESGGVATTDATFAVDGITVISGAFEGSSISAVQNTFDHEGDDDGVVYLVWNADDEQWECIQMECP